MLSQEEKKAAIKQRHAEQCSIMAEIMDVEEILAQGPISFYVELELEGHVLHKAFPYPELREKLQSTANKFLTERLETLWLALESSQNTPIEMPQ